MTRRARGTPQGRPRGKADAHDARSRAPEFVQSQLPQIPLKTRVTRCSYGWSGAECRPNNADFRDDAEAGPPCSANPLAQPPIPPPPPPPGFWLRPTTPRRQRRFPSSVCASLQWNLALKVIKMSRNLWLLVQGFTDAWQASRGYYETVERVETASACM